jgi:hypothetical protein
MATPKEMIIAHLSELIAVLRKERDAAWEAYDLDLFNQYQGEIQETLAELAEELAEYPYETRGFYV